MINLISDLVSFKTVYPNYDEFDKCNNYIKDYFKNTNLIIKEYEQNNEKSLVIANNEEFEQDIIFCGHLDVVPAEDDSMFSVKQIGNILYGRGVADMKGQDVVMMKIMKELDTNKKVALFLTPDEERSGNGVKTLLEKGYTAKIGVIPDGGLNFQLVIEEKAVLTLKITALGKECHSSRLWNGDNAIIKLYDIYNEIIQRYGNPKSEEDWKTSFNLAKIEGGNVFNMVPGNALMYIDIRYIKDNTEEEIIEYIQNISKDITVEVIHKGSIFYTDSNNEYIQRYIESCEKILGHKIKIIKAPAASDARFFTTNNIPCILSNAIGGNIHCIDEWIDLESLDKLFKIYKIFIESF